MGTSKKPRKPYRGKPVHMPMMAETHAGEAISLHMLIDRLIADATPDTYNAITRKMATYSDAMSHMRGNRSLANDRDAEANALRSALMTLGAIYDKWERTGGKAVKVSDLEAKSLRAASLTLDKAIGRIPVNVLKAAEITVNNYAEAMK